MRLNPAQANDDPGVRVSPGRSSGDEPDGIGGIADRLPESEGEPTLMRPDKSMDSKVVPGKKIRINLDVSPAIDRRITQLATHLGVSRSDVIRKAVSLFGRAVDAHLEGLRVGTVDPDGRLVAQYVGFED